MLIFADDTVKCLTEVNMQGCFDHVSQAFVIYGLTSST